LEEIRVVTDSTADLTPETAREHGIEVIPLSVIHGDATYLDRVDITPESFYRLLSESQDLPKTSQPTPHQFMEVFMRLVDKGYRVLAIHLSSNLSSTVETARAAASALLKDRVHVVDSRFASYGLAFQALEAARMVRQGKALEEILKRLDYIRQKTELALTVGTLDYLYRGGRIGKATCLLSNLLSIKPVVRLEDGVVTAAGKARSTRQALSAIVQIMAERFRDEKVRVAVGHGRALEHARTLAGMLSDCLNIEEDPTIFEVGPVIGVHTGPGTVGAVVCPAS